MKTNQKYLFVSFVAAVAVAGMSLAAIGSAQTVVPVTCSVNSSSVNVDQAAILTATGGNGTYSWSGPNLSVTNSTGSQFAVTYPSVGTYPITVSSEGLSATCNVNVVTAPVGSLSCSPAVQNVTLGQVASVSASGGNGSYTWSSPDLTISNPTGSGFSADYASSGFKTLTVSSAGLTATCAVNVIAGTVTTPPVTTPVTPGLPDTGGGYGQ